jgi:7-cyano-7-deazaguanine synthase
MVLNATSKRSRAVVLLSGGMDSCVCAALAARDHQAAAVHISYGQRTEQRERRSFECICDRLEIRDRLLVRNAALGAIGGSALTDPSIAVPEAHALGAGVPVTYVPFRNAHFLAVAVSWAEVLGAEKVYIGAVEPDSSGYPDCRPEYYRAFNEVGAPFDLTWSCYQREDRACGVCDSCVLRRRAFREAGAEDPIPYAEPAARLS